MVKDGNSQQQLVKRFKKAVARSKVLSDVRKKRWFVSESRSDESPRKKQYGDRRSNRVKEDPETAEDIKQKSEEDVFKSISHSGGEMALDTSFAVGDWIVHKWYGIGQIKKIEKKPIEGEKVRVFNVAIEDGAFFVPVNDEDNPRVYGTW